MNVEPTLRDINKAAKWYGECIDDPERASSKIEMLAWLVAEVRAAERERCAKALERSDSLAGVHFAKKLRELPCGEDDPQPAPPKPGSPSGGDAR